MQLAIVDSGGANIGSVIYALRRLGIEAGLTADVETISSASHVILPGVGAASTAMRKLQSNGLDRLIPNLTQPVLGICLGMQLMYESSDEGHVNCLGVFAGKAQAFVPDRQRRVPHMGWNQLEALSHESPLLKDIEAGEYAYFVHSYALPVSIDTIASCHYGGKFAAMAQRKNFYAAQFHPERSAKVGAMLLKNFLEI